LIVTEQRAICPVIVVLLVTLGAALSATSEGISPLHAQAVFSRSSPGKAWSEFVRTTSGKKVYRLFFDPQRDVSGILVGVDLVLSDSMHGPGLNLLNPPGNWHGLQPYDFVASDFLHGPNKSGFGAHRVISVDRKGIVVDIDVLDVKVSASPGGKTQIDTVNLSIDVQNLSH
jgi:hypothetical protein